MAREIEVRDDEEECFDEVAQCSTSILPRDGIIGVVCIEMILMLKVVIVECQKHVWLVQKRMWKNQTEG